MNMNMNMNMNARSLALAPYYSQPWGQLPVWNPAGSHHLEKRFAGSLLDIGEVLQNLPNSLDQILDFTNFIPEKPVSSTNEPRFKKRRRVRQKATVGNYKRGSVPSTIVRPVTTTTPPPNLLEKLSKVRLLPGLPSIGDLSRNVTRTVDKIKNKMENNSNRLLDLLARPFQTAHMMTSMTIAKIQDQFSEIKNATQSGFDSLRPENMLESLQNMTTLMENKTADTINTMLVNPLENAKNKTAEQITQFITDAKNQTAETLNNMVTKAKNVTTETLNTMLIKPLKEAQNKTAETFKDVLVTPLKKAQNQTTTTLTNIFLEPMKKAQDDLLALKTTISSLKPEHWQIIARVAPTLIPYIIENHTPKLEFFLSPGSNFTIEELYTIHASLKDFHFYLESVKDDINNEKAPTIIRIANFVLEKNKKLMHQLFHLIAKANLTESKSITLSQEDLETIEENMTSPKEIYSLLMAASENLETNDETERNMKEML